MAFDREEDENIKRGRACKWSGRDQHRWLVGAYLILDDTLFVSLKIKI